MYVLDLKCVITGDVVGSTDMPGDVRQRLSQAIRDAYQRVQNIFSESLHLHIDIFRGDSIQLYVERSEDGLPIAILLRALLKHSIGAETRMAIAIDSVDFLNRQT